MKYKQISIWVEDYGEWVIRNDGSIYFSDEFSGAYWESDIAIFRDYTSDILYKQFVEEVEEDTDDVMPFRTFEILVADSFKAFEL